MSVPVSCLYVGLHVEHQVYGMMPKQELLNFRCGPLKKVSYSEECEDQWCVWMRLQFTQHISSAQAQDWNGNDG